MKIPEVNRDESVAIYDQVAAKLRRAIADGEAKPGERLPPAVDLAKVLRVNKNTVIRALHLLRDEGLLDFTRGRGVRVVHPQNTFRTACRQMARYAISDGQSRIRNTRLFRNAARCVLEVLALILLRWTWIPLLAILALESWYAYHRDGRDLLRFGARAMVARFAFSIAVPWVVAVNQIRGRFSAKPLSNWQNVQG